MALVFAHHGILYVVLDEENVERITQYDPFDFNSHNIGQPIALKVPLEVVVAYARTDEQAELAEMQPDKLVAYLRRGFRTTPSDFQRVRPYATLKKKS